MLHCSQRVVYFICYEYDTYLSRMLQLILSISAVNHSVIDGKQLDTLNNFSNNYPVDDVHSYLGTCLMNSLPILFVKKEVNEIT